MKPKLAQARRMRGAPSANEAKLWRLTRDRRLAGLKLRRQVPSGPYVADFACMRHRLVIEVDGPLHDAQADAVRDAWLKRDGWRVLRFTTTEVAGDPHGVLARILKAVEAPRATRYSRTSLLPLREKVASLRAE